MSKPLESSQGKMQTRKPTEQTVRSPFNTPLPQQLTWPLHFLNPQEEAGHLHLWPLFTFLLILLTAPTESGVDVLSFQPPITFVFSSRPPPGPFS